MTTPQRSKNPKRPGKPKRPVGRPPVKQRQIARDIRKQIVGGSLPVSARLATREELRQQYNASSETVQQALSQLKTDGFVVSRGSLGTFVTDTPPHLARYMIVCQKDPAGHHYPRFWTAIATAAEQLRRDEGLDLQVFTGVEPHNDVEAYRNLVTETRRHCLAGLIFLHPPFEYLNTPLMEEPGIPRVAIMVPHPDTPGVQCVLPSEQFYGRALDHLASQGRTRVAILANRSLPDSERGWLEEQVMRRQMRMEPYWLQFSVTGEPMLTRHLVHLLMNENQVARPDCLVIADDNLVEAACAGLVRAGVRVPEDVEIVAHCNYPLPTPSVLPVKRLGFSAHQVIRQCVKSIDAQRRGDVIRPPIHIPAVFEEELADDVSVEQS